MPPPYAILSHTWRKNEISFQDMTSCADVQSKPEYDKIRNSSRKALHQKLDFIWIDSCCIDKSSSAELSEAINSMFRWYKDAVVCFAYLEDLPIGQSTATKPELERCRWFTRGWTLQELIAPKEVRFYDRGWNCRGTKETLQDSISSITAIKTHVLLGKHLNRLGSIPVAERMSWASRRETTRQEDMAYCLLGIFGVNMALIYGEGANAFTRLQEEIIKRTNDLSIFAWDSRGRSSGPYCGLLAESPAEFSRVSPSLFTDTRFFTTEFTVTNRGLRMTTELWVPPNLASFNRDRLGYFLCLSHSPSSSNTFIGIHLKKVGQSSFVRISDKPLTADYLQSTEPDREESFRLQTIYIATSYSTETSLDTMMKSPPCHFPAHAAFRVSGVAPRAGWDVFDRLLHAGGAGFSSFFGVICFEVSDTGNETEASIKLGLLINLLGGAGPECSLFKWQGTAQQQMGVAFEQGSEAVLPQTVMRAMLAMSHGTNVDYHFGSGHFRVSASMRREIVKEISAEPLHTVHLQRLKSANGEDWVALD